MSEATAAAERIAFGRPWITGEDRRAVLEVLDGPILTHGPKGRAFETEFAAFMGDSAHCVAVSSGMAALHLASIALGLGPGDEVIAPAQTHVATANAIEWVGARPVFVDCDEATGNVTPDRIAAAIGPRTKAISVVHFDGIPCDMPSIVQLADRHGIPVIEDCALAVGTRIAGMHAGLFGVLGCFSFYPVKHITTGEGGMVSTRDPDLAARIGRIRAHGVDKTFAERTIPGMYDVVALGLNYRMSEMQSALGRSQLRRIDENLRQRAMNFERLAVLRDVPSVRVIDAADPRATSSHYCLTVVLDGPLGPKRDAFVTGLNAHGIETSIYYPQPVPRMRFYRERYGYDPSAFPNATAISDRSIALPVGPHLSTADVDRIVGAFRAVAEELG